MAETQTNGGLPPQILRQLRQIREEFSRDILPQIKARGCFISNGEKRRGKTRISSHQKPAIRFSPFAMTLGNGLLDVRSPVRKSRLVRMAIIPAQTGQLVSVFIVTMVKTNPPVYVMQKVQKKSAPGFPGGGIENGETILEAAAREYDEESRGNSAKGVNIIPYNPLCIGKFVLDRAESGEQGAVVLVEIPESEIANLKAGGGAEEGEIIEKVFFMTFDEVAEKVKSRTILPNSVRIWDLYCNYLVNAP